MIRKDAMAKYISLKMAKGEERRAVKEHKRSMGRVPIQDAEKEFIAGFRFKMYLLRSTAESIFCGPNKEREMLGQKLDHFLSESSCNER